MASISSESSTVVPPGRTAAAKKRRRRWWAREIFLQRFQYGNRLMREMQVELVDDIIMNFTRMTTEDFERLVSLISPKVERVNANTEEPCITVKEKLVITLRFLATGDSHMSLQYLFRVSKSSISLIIPEVCGAIIEALQDYVKVIGL